LNENEMHGGSSYKFYSKETRMTYDALVGVGAVAPRGSSKRRYEARIYAAPRIPFTLGCG